MTGVRMGERVLQVGLEDARLAARIVVKPGMSGHAAIVANDEREGERARSVAADAGVLVDVHIAPLHALPLETASFDVVIVHATSPLVGTSDASARVRGFGECYRVLRPGGRLVALAPGTPTGLAAIWRKAPKSASDSDAGAGIENALQIAGFRPVRLLADRDGYRFFEGLKT